MSTRIKRLTAPGAGRLRLRLASLRLLTLIEAMGDEGAESGSTSRNPARRREWVSAINRRRQLLGEHNNLVQEMRLNQPTRHIQYFRLPKQGFDLLLSKIENKIRRQHTNFRAPVSPEERLAVTLRYMASGMEFAALAPTYRLGETTCREIVYDTCRAIIEVLGPQYLPPPTADTWKASESGFRNRWEFPNCVAALDGKQVVMEAPANTGSAYFTYKRQFAMVLMAAVDSNYNFVYVSVGSAGRESDGAIFRSLDLGRRLADGNLQLPGPKALPGTNTVLPHVIVADEAFPLLPNVMRPYPGRREARMGIPASIFNYRLSRARRIVENAFGILAQVWRLFRRPLNVTPEHAQLLVMTSCILHNFRRSGDFEGLKLGGVCDDTETTTDDDGTTAGLVDLPRPLGPNNYSQSAERVREQFMNYFMTTGEAEWQWREQRRH